MPTAEWLIKRFQQLESQRSNWDTHWQDIAEKIWPDAADFIIKRQPGEKRAQDVYDATAALALEKFAAALESMLTPRNQKWHRLKAADEELNEDETVRRWFDEVNKIIFRVRNSPKAGYYSQKHEGYKSLGAFGNECLYVDELEAGGIRYKHCHVGTIFTEIDHHGKVDTIFRKYRLSAKAAVQRWGIERSPDRVQRALAEKPFNEFEFLHCVIPRMEGFNPERADAFGMPWAAYEIGVADKVIIEEGGYHEMPYQYSRYTVNPAERYGRSPAMLVLPGVRMLQEMKKTHIRAGHKIADPPLLLQNDGVLGFGSSQVRLEAGGLNYGGVDEQGRQTIQPLQTGGRLDISEGMMESERITINDAFLVTLFQILVDNPQMTATEALLRAQEKGQLLAPTTGRQQSEMLGPQVEREFSILLRQGRLPPVPEQLIDAEYEIEYETPMTRLQQSEEVTAVTRTIEVAAPFVQIDPAVLEVFKADDVVRHAARILGVPDALVRTEEELAEVREIQAQEEQQAQTIEQAPAAAKALKDASEAQANLRAIEGGRA